MQNWFMVTLVGRDQPGIVAQVTAALFAAGGHLGEASMLRLGGNFTIMMMVQLPADGERLRQTLTAVAEQLQLRLHIDPIEGALHQHLQPDVQIRVHSADRAGIVAQVTAAFAEAGLHILDLTSDVAGSRDKPFYIMQIEGYAERGMEPLQAALAPLLAAGIEVRLEPLDTLIG